MTALPVGLLGWGAGAQRAAWSSTRAKYIQRAVLSSKFIARNDRHVDLTCSVLDERPQMKTRNRHSHNRNVSRGLHQHQEGWSLADHQAPPLRSLIQVLIFANFSLSCDPSSLTLGFILFNTMPTFAHDPKRGSGPLSV